MLGERAAAFEEIERVRGQATLTAQILYRICVVYELPETAPRRSKPSSAL
jgi:hypothetical protein